MEKELNYLSEKIEIVEHNLNVAKFGVKNNTHTKEDVVDLEHELEMLNNILNTLTIQAIY